MTLKELEAIENAIRAAAASVVSGAQATLTPKLGFSGTPAAWVNDNIYKLVHDALLPALDDAELERLARGGKV